METMAGEWERLVASEFLQCPGLRLTANQAARLFGLNDDEMETILAGLVEREVLRRGANGMFVRRGECPRCG